MVYIGNPGEEWELQLVVLGEVYSVPELNQNK